MKVIFLDIDGVLNSERYFRENNELITNYERLYNGSINRRQLLEKQMLNIDNNCLNLLVNLVNKTHAKVIITSSWRVLDIFKMVCDRLQYAKIPIIGVTIYDGVNRGSGIKNYIEENNIKKYIILDDDVYPDYDDELSSHLIKTSFYQGGLTTELMEEAIDKLNSNIFVKIKKIY